MEEKRGFWKGLVCGLVIAVLFGGIILVSKQVVGFFQIFQDSKQEVLEDTEVTTEEEERVVNDESLEKIEILENMIEVYYHEDVSDEVLRQGMYEGILASLEDPYSEYYSPEEFQAIMEQTEGIYYGIGAYISTNTETGLTMVSGLIPNTPAAESGLLPGDQIYKVNGEDVTGLTSEKVVMKIKGEENTQVTLTIIREGEMDTLDFTITRKKIESPTITYEMYEGNIAYIGIMEFDEITLPQFEEALQKAKDEDMKGLILDLRDNPGGNLDTVNEIARLLLPEGLIVYTEDKYGERVEYKCDGKNEIQVPLVVLVNGNSASASEILAGAIKDYQKGTILGTTTYGKGIVQKIMGLEDGSAVKITVSSYFTPNGINIHKIGVEPDEVLELDVDRFLEEGYDNQLERALEILRK